MYLYHTLNISLPNVCFNWLHPGKYTICSFIILICQPFFHVLLLESTSHEGRDFCVLFISIFQGTRKWDATISVYQYKYDS